MKLINVKVLPGSSRQAVVKLGEDSYKVWVHSPPRGGRANKEVKKLLALHFSTPASRIRLIKGARSRIKTFGIDISSYSGNIGEPKKEV